MSKNGIKVEKYIFHMSNPIFRDKILMEGLIPRGKSEAWLSDTDIDGAVIFASNHKEPSKWFDSGYDDDIYRIDTSILKNVWFNDPNFIEDNYIITFDAIPIFAIELIYKGTGGDTDDLGAHPFITEHLLI